MKNNQLLLKKLGIENLTKEQEEQIFQIATELCNITLSKWLNEHAIEVFFNVNDQGNFVQISRRRSKNHTHLGKLLGMHPLTEAYDL